MQAPQILTQSSATDFCCRSQKLLVVEELLAANPYIKKLLLQKERIVCMQAGKFCFPLAGMVVQPCVWCQDWLSSPCVGQSSGFVWEWCGNRKSNIISCYLQFHLFSLCGCIYLLEFKTCDIEGRYYKSCAQFYFV